MEFNFDDLRDLIAALNQTDVTELTLKSESFELVIRKDARVSDRAFSLEGAGTGESPVPVPTLTAPPIPSPTPAATVPTTPTPAPPAADRYATITSPMVGTFYRSPAPDESPFVDVGDRVRSGQTVCIIEAMKLMNELESEVSGEIVEILVENGEPVEYGQVLMRVNPG